MLEAVRSTKVPVMRSFLPARLHARTPRLANVQMRSVNQLSEWHHTYNATLLKLLIKSKNNHVVDSDQNCDTTERCHVKCRAFVSLLGVETVPRAVVASNRADCFSASLWCSHVSACRSEQPTPIHIQGAVIHEVENWAHALMHCL